MSAVADRTKRPWTIVTMPMRRRMRELRAWGLGSDAIARVIAGEFALAQPPSRGTIDVHAPRAVDAARGRGVAKGTGR